MAPPATERCCLAVILLFLSLFVQSSTAIYCGAEDCYALLGVAQDANASDIKRSYYKLSLMHHPDKNPDPESKKLFVKIATAYEILKDNETRAQYDYAIEHSEEVFYNTAQYYRAKYGHKSDPRAVLVGLLVVLSAFQYLNNVARYNELQMSVGNKDKLDSGDLGRTISGNEETLSDASYGEENVTKIVNNNMEASGDDIVEEESKSPDCDLYVISKDKCEKQQMIINRQQTNTEELKHDLKSIKAGLSLLQMKYQQEFTSLGVHLHGLVQDLKGSIRVYCRVRLYLPGQTSGLTTVDNIEESTISIATPSKYAKEGRKSFTFNKVFGPSASQEAVFADTQPLIRSVLDGYNVRIFAYFSGKTFTMMGTNELTKESLGVNYRA